MTLSDCGLIAHRTCAATGLPPCVKQSSKYFRHILLSSVFGLSLCTQFAPGDTPAPPLLVRCCQEIVFRVKSDPNLNPYRLYRTPPQQETLAQLRQACDEGKPKSSFITSHFFTSALLNCIMVKF